MTDREAEISRLQQERIQASTRAEKRMYGTQFLMAVIERNKERTPEQVEELERERGLR